MSVRVMSLNGRFDPRRLSRPNGSKWRRKMRAALIVRDGAGCRVRQNEDVPLQIDHVHALRDGGDNALANLQFICAPCHTDKTRGERVTRSVKP
jgi:5-methylcytosine-specific restriction endonuclease McrA